jgi:hypothetical protein
MRKIIISLALAASLAVAPTAHADTPENEVLFSFVSAFCNIAYMPAKFMLAAVGMPLGGVAGLLNGGDNRAAEAFWVPMVGGTYMLTSDMMAGHGDVEFWGSDYSSHRDRAYHAEGAYRRY